MYFTKQEIQNNINSQYGINNQVQLSLINGNTQFIIELSKQMNISYTIPSLALHISQIFFQKKCYLFYDRFIILTASFALASKLKDMDCRLKSLCHSYYNIISRMTMNFEPYNEQKMKKIKDQICIGQNQILRTLEYKIDFDTPHEYLKKYVETLAQPRDVVKKVYNSSRIIILDSYRSKCCLMFNPLTICVAALLIACRYEGFRPYISEQIIEYVRNQELKQQKSLSVSIKDDTVQQGQIPKEQPQNSRNQYRFNHIKRRSNQQNQLNHQAMYAAWLKNIRQKQEETLEQQDILECIRMINSVILSTAHLHWR